MRKELDTKIMDLVKEIEPIARQYGLDPVKTIFEIVNFEEMNEIASYGGFPKRFSHWLFGMTYEHMEKSYSYGLHKIYELVVNNDPCYACLLENNQLIDQKLVITHVFAHSDFFKNNIWFSKTDRKMMDEIGNHAARIEKYSDRYGKEEIERFIDCCFSLNDLIDFYSLFIQREQAKKETSMVCNGEEEKEKIKRLELKQPKEYMEDFINPEDFIHTQEEELKKTEAEKFPLAPQKDVLLFLLQYAPLKDWQKDILSMFREEAYYFAPQGFTKIMNEGWAAYWHTKILTGTDKIDKYHVINAPSPILKDSELIDYADHHSGTTGRRPGQLNPYKLGIELFRDIEERWNKGKFGKEYDECEDLNEKKKWDKDLGLGRKKIFDVRKTHNDITFIDHFLTKEFCDEQKLFTYEYNPQTQMYEITKRGYREIKEKVLFSLTNFGKPVVRVEDGNYNNRGELYLKHDYFGVEMRLDYAKDTLKNINALWQRPVHLETVVKDEKILFSFDGKEHRESKFGEWMDKK